MEQTTKKPYFSKGEIGLWLFSVTAILVTFFIFPNDGILSLIASLIGVTSLIVVAKGNPIGQVMMIAFSLLYGYISFGFTYYGEMLTYVGMSAPMAIFSLIAWLRNPYNGNKIEVRVNHISLRELPFMLLLNAAVTTAFYFILAYFNTANLIVSTLSVATSFLAVYLTFRRSPYYALAYAVNDIVLLALWGLASLTDISYLSMVICFAVFLVNDIHGFLSWQRLAKRQKENGFLEPSKHE